MENKFLYCKQSTIPNAGLGVFAKCFIPRGTVICEYEGDIVDDESFEKASAYEKDRTIGCSDGISIIGRGIGAMINDIVDFREYPENVLVDILYHNFMPVHEGKDHNCLFFHDPKRRFPDVVAVKNIEKDQEIFVKYGNHYWERKFDEEFYHYHERVKASGDKV